MRLVQQMPAGSGCLFREQFYSLDYVSGNGGVVVASTIDRGIASKGVSSRVTYNGSNTILNNATQATWRIKLRTPAVFTDAAWFLKSDQGWGAALQWGCETTAGGLILMYLGPGASDCMFRNAALSVSTEYTIHFVYNGSLAAANRGLVFWNGVQQATLIGGTLPTVITPVVYPVTIFNRANGVNRAPNTDARIYDAVVWNRDLSASEVADDYADRSYLEIV